MRYLMTLVISLLFLITSFSQLARAQDVKTYIHPRAVALIPVIKQELAQNFNTIPFPWYLPGLIEHESCISLKHSRCWSPTSKLDTKWKSTGKQRELGVGLGQITKAWTEAGQLRFDTLANLKRMYPKELGYLTWDNMMDHPELQIRAMLLLLKSDYNTLNPVPDPVERLKMADSAYNGGVRDVQRARKTCGLTKGCNPDLWFNHVEIHSPKSTKVMYGNRSPRDINLHHVRDVFHTRMYKFKPLIPTLD